MDYCLHNLPSAQLLSGIKMLLVLVINDSLWMCNLQLRFDAINFNRFKISLLVQVSVVVILARQVAIALSPVVPLQYL